MVFTRRQTRPRRTYGALWALVALTVWSLPTSLESQERTGPIIPVGLVRFDFGLSLHAWDDRFGERIVGGSTIEEEEPLGLDFSSSAVGTDVFPALAALENALGFVDTDQDLPISMGATDVFLSYERLTLPIRIEAGLLPWLSIGGTVPLSRRRSETFVGVDGTGANTGVSPTMTDPALVSDFLGSLRAATEALDLTVQGICADQGSASAACSDAQLVFNDAEGFRVALTNAYLVSPGFPLDGSDAAMALIGKLGTLGQMAGQLGSGGFPTDLPFSTTLLDAEQFNSIITDEGGSIQGLPFGDWRGGWEVGDIEVFANARVLGRSVLLPPAEGRFLRYEVGLGALLRLGTGRADSEDNFIDLGTGDGTTDVEGRIWLNLRGGSRFGLWADARYGVQGSTSLVRRISAPDQPLAPAAWKAPVDWTPGSYLRAELVPRLHLTEEVAVAFSLVHRRKGVDEFALLGVAPETAPDVSVLALETEESLTEVGFALMFSSLAARSRDRSAGRRMEFRFRFAKAISGRGGRTPKGARFDLGLRLFRRFWGEDPEG